MWLLISRKVRRLTWLTQVDYIKSFEPLTLDKLRPAHGPYTTTGLSPNPDPEQTRSEWVKGIRLFELQKVQIIPLSTLISNGPFSLEKHWVRDRVERERKSKNGDKHWNDGRRLLRRQIGDLGVDQLHSPPHSLQSRRGTFYQSNETLKLIAPFVVLGFFFLKLYS